jgi:hypothetical protein
MGLIPISSTIGAKGLPSQHPYPLRVQFGLGAVLRAAGFEDSGSTELADVLSAVAFCAPWLAVLSASEVGRRKRLEDHAGLIRRGLERVVVLPALARAPRNTCLTNLSLNSSVSGDVRNRRR